MFDQGRVPEVTANTNGRAAETVSAPNWFLCAMIAKERRPLSSGFPARGGERTGAGGGEGARKADELPDGGQSGDAPLGPKEWRSLRVRLPGEDPGRIARTAAFGLAEGNSPGRN